MGMVVTAAAIELEEVIRQAIPTMELVKVDVLGIQTLQTGLTSLADVCRAGIVARHLSGVLLERVPELRGNDDVVAVRGEGPAQ